MPNPILFFVIIIIIDLLLKSVKDKKRIEEAKTKNPNQAPARGRQDLRKLLEEELERQRKRPEGKAQMDKRSRIEEKPIRERIDKNPRIEKRESKPSIRTNMISQEAKAEPKENMELNIKKNLLNGIIFSEILSEPKAVQRQKRSL